MAEGVGSPGRPDPVPWDSVLSKDLAKLGSLSDEVRAWCMSTLDRQETHRRHLRWADRCLHGFGALLSGGAATLVGIFFLGLRAGKRDRTGDLGRVYGTRSVKVIEHQQPPDLGLGQYRVHRRHRVSCVDDLPCAQLGGSASSAVSTARPSAAKRRPIADPTA
jgi:hypothetical protein